MLVTACGGGAEVSSGTVTVQSRVTASTDDVEEAQAGTVVRSSADLDLVRDDADQLIGLRFTEVDVPRGALITDAYIGFTAEEASSEETSLTVRGVVADTVATFISTRFNVSSQTGTDAAVAWSPPPWTTAGAPDPERGVRQFVVGTGGEELYNFGTVQPGSEARIANTYGVIS